MEVNVDTSNCYCLTENDDDPHMMICSTCKKKFHPLCLKSGPPSNIAGDIYFKFTCENCSSSGVEIINRIKLQWTLVIILALYNLQLEGSGKCGYFRWREHICSYIDKNWSSFFGSDKKKSATWHGTVAGSLSTGANRFFLSGVDLLGETGWWSLKSSKLPSISEIESVNTHLKVPRRRKTQPPLDTLVVEGSRKRSQNVVEAAVALKEMKEYFPDTPRRVKKKSKIIKSETEESCTSQDHFYVVPKIEPLDDTGESTADMPNRGIPKIIIKSEKRASIEDAVDQWFDTDISSNLDINTSSGSLNFQDLLQPSGSTTSFGGSLPDANKIHIKEEESEEESSNSSKVTGNTKKLQHTDMSRKRKAVTKDENPMKEVIFTDPKFTMMSMYDEEQLLKKLQDHPNAVEQNISLKKLYRKLVVRKLKRENNLAVFDIDAEVRSIRGMDPPDYISKDNPSKVVTPITKINSILDRYQIRHYNPRGNAHQHSSFITRLMGVDDEHQESIISPYTARVLPPFIFNDYKCKPLKLKLLEEIRVRANKIVPNWKPTPQSPIDYCYIRPQHIPGVNALCQEFFWPGIDMSESLQYPDFSCVALYKKVIVGFAFMVPDVKYNEAYITFIFCHPEWRRAGIATFMLYHLIQTCMGKDITLHVSATSSAVFFYQKFGFKEEELILDFYDKYLPPDSRECRHALLLRLNR